MITVRTTYEESDLIEIIKLNYGRPLDASLLSAGDLQLFADGYTEILLTANGSGPSIGWLTRQLILKIIHGLISGDLPDPPTDGGASEWTEVDW